MTVIEKERETEDFFVVKFGTECQFELLYCSTHAFIYFRQAMIE